MASFVGMWKMETNEHFDDYLKAVGVGFATRKMVKMAKPATEIIIEGDTWRLKTLGMKTTEVSFKLDQEFSEKTADGRDCKTTFSLSPDGKKLTQVQKGSVPSTLTRDLIDDNKMSMKLEAKGVVCTRAYKRG